LKTPGQRLHLFRKSKKGLTQRAIADALELKAPSVSLKESGAVPVTVDDANKLKAAFGLSVGWLLAGEGEMLTNDAPILNEPSVSYQLKSHVWDSQNINERFRMVVDDSMMKLKLLQGELAERWKINKQLLSNVVHGKDVSLAMLVSALRYGNVNINFILGGIGPMYNSDTSTSTPKDPMLLQILDELHEMRKLMPEKKRA